MVTHSNSNFPGKVSHPKIKGKTKAKHTMIASLIARGFPVKDVAKQVNLSESQIYHLLSANDSFVNAEIFRILRELFTENDLHLVDLYKKALQKLDNMLSSPDEEKQFRAIDRIIKIFLTRSAKNPVSIQQYFGIESQNEREPKKTMDDIILEMRKKRGLPMEDSDEDSFDSSEDDSSPGAFSPLTSSPPTSSPLTSSLEEKTFFEKLK